MPFITELKGNRTLQGVCWMVLTTLLFVSMTSVIRYLGSEVPSVQAAFIRYAIAVVFTIPILWRFWPIRMSMQTFGLYSARAAVHAIGVMLWFYAMARISVAEVTAIGYASPIFVALGAGLFLGETLRARRIIGIIIGFVGTLIILRPGFQEINSGQIAQLCATPLFAISFLIAKKLTAKENSVMIVSMLSVGCTIALLPGALIQWETPTWTEMMWLTLTAFFATAGHYTLTRAIEAAPLTVTQPLGFLQLIWAIIIGYIFFNEGVDHFVLLGGAIIIASTTYISHRELQNSKKRNRQEGSNVQL